MEPASSHSAGWRKGSNPRTLPGNAAGKSREETGGLICSEVFEQGRVCLGGSKSRIPAGSSCPGAGQDPIYA